MRIQELEIQRFGVWKEVKMPFHDRGVSVLYGPNEAGKSTLMRFIRGVLYGYNPSDELDASRRQERVICSGSLNVSHQGKTYRIHRISEPGTRGRLEINGQKVEQNDPLMQSLIGDASESLFRDVFAIGLPELQQLATLSGDEIAEQIYGLSLGREGEQIVRANNAFQRAEKQIIDPDHRKGEIYSLLQELAQIDRELERVGQPAQRHSRLIDQTNKHDTSVSELKRKQANLQSDLRGYQFLDQVYKPWSKHRRLLKAFDQLPVTKLDIEILHRFDEMELELSEIDANRKQLIEEAKRQQKQAEAIQLRPELEEHVCPIKNLFEQASEIRALDQQLQGRQSSPEPQQQEIRNILSSLEGHWDLKRLTGTDLSPKRMHELFKIGEDFRQTNRSRSKAARKYKRMAAELKDYEQQSRIQTRGPGAKNVELVRSELVHKIDELESLRGLKIRKSHLQKTIRLFPKEQEVEAVDQPLPPFFYHTLWFFAIAGGILFLSGTYKAFTGLGSNGTHAAIIGACYSLLGLASLGICWTMKQYFSQQKIQVKSFEDDKHKLEQELAEVEQSILRIQSQHLLQPQRSAPHSLATNRDDSNLIESTLVNLREQIHGLQTATDDTSKVESLRREMSEMRSSLQDYQKRVSHSRRNWNEALRQFGLPETLKVDEAVYHCQRIVEAQRAVESWNRSHQSKEQKQQQVELFLEKVQQLSELIEGRGIAVRNPYQLLEEWHRELELLGERRRERSQLRSTAKEKRREAARLTDKVERMREQRSLLLSQMGVNDRNEIAAKLAAIDERKTLEVELKEAEHALFQVTQHEPELVITEEMLENYDEVDNRSQLKQIRDELQEIDETLQFEYQTLGKLKQELRDIEEDRSVASLRFDREQIVDALHNASESLLANRLANHVVNELSGRIERDRQPQTLKTASEYLRQLTCEKYQKVWTPLGEKALLVDDDSGQALRVEQLSSGTREQVFLALRLAMIKDFANQGIELPMILDDVTVNFDQIRTEAAVETLLNVADEGQQIMLFTCHLHLAHLFEAENVDPIWLPNHRPEMSV